MNKTRDFSAGSWCWWEPGYLPKTLLRESLDAVGLTNVATSFSTSRGSLKSAVSVLANAIGKGRSVKVESLRNSNLIGFEATDVGGDGKRNEHRHLFSAVLADSGVQLVSYSESSGITSSNASNLEDALTRHYTDEETRMPATQVSNVLQPAILGSLQGIKCRRAGVVFFVPPWAVEVLEDLAARLYSPPSSFLLTTETASLFNNERTLELVARSFKEQVTDAIGEVNAEIAALEGKAYENGTKSRLSRLMAARQKVDKYEEFLGVQLDDLRKAIADSEDVVNEAAVAALVL